MSDPIRYELEQANKTELAEMYRSVFRPTIRPSLLEVLNGYTKDQIIDRLLAIQKRAGDLDA